jgi:hypothetical protein
MTTREKKAARIKMLVSGPWRKAMAVAMDTASAEWLEGIPPVFQKKVRMTSLKFRAFERKIFTTALRNCAVSRLKMADKNTGFENISVPSGLATTLTTLVSPLQQALSRRGTDPVLPGQSY